MDLSGRPEQEEVIRGSEARWASGRKSCSMHFSVCFVYSSYHDYRYYCLLLLQSVKLPLSRRTSFCLFLSILLPTPAREGQ